MSYIFFAIAALACFTAEVREFSLRYALYRVHDVAIYTPWKYLLLYFLWLSCFAPFTPQPTQSLVYAGSGWFSLISIAFTAPLIFCERGAESVVLLPKNLQKAFIAYTLAMLLCSGLLLSNLYAPNTLNFYLCFTLGLPFIVWDLTKSGAHLVPRLLSAAAILASAYCLFILSKKVFFISFLMSFGALFLLALYKRQRVQSILLTFFLGALALTCLVFFFEQNITSQVLATRFMQELEPEKQFIELSKSEISNWWIGTGVGLTNIKKGIATRVLAETGLPGMALYLAFFISLLRQLFQIRHAEKIVVSNVAFISVVIFLTMGSRFLSNPYTPIIWVWYGIWGLFALTWHKKWMSAR
jgi:hypothetical protein